MTLGWTRSHTAVAASIATVAVGSVAATFESGAIAILVGVSLAATGVISLALDPLGGLVVGLAGATEVTVLRRAFGAWTTNTFWHALVETLALLAAGFVAGFAARHLRARPAPLDLAGADHMSALSLTPAFGSLGLLGADLGMMRLEEEVERACRHDRPLSIAVFSAVERTELSAQGRRSGLRTLARIVEGRLSETDIPFALDENELIAILPEADAVTLWNRIGPVADAISGASFRDREHSTERRFADWFDLGIGLATIGGGLRSADGLLDAARQAARQDLSFTEHAVA